MFIRPFHCTIILCISRSDNGVCSNCSSSIRYLILLFLTHIYCSNSFTIICCIIFLAYYSVFRKTWDFLTIMSGRISEHSHNHRWYYWVKFYQIVCYFLLRVISLIQKQEKKQHHIICSQYLPRCCWLN